MKHNEKRLILSMAIMSALGMASSVTYAGQTLPAVPLNWTAGTATVDGNTSDWNLSTDASTRMCEAGWINTDGSCNGKEQLSTLYTRYNCNTNTMYVLVLKAAGHTADNSASWVKVYTLGNSPRVQGPSNSANFHDVTVGGVVQGYEASFTLNAGTYNDMEVHIQIDGGRTSSTGKVQYTRSIVVPENCTVPTATTPQGPTSGTVGGYDGFNNWGQCQSAKSGGTTLSVVGRLLPAAGVNYNDTSVTGEVYNNSDTPQTVTLVSYKEFYPDTNFDDDTVNGVLVPGQRVNDYQTVTVPAKGHVNLTAQLPGCSTQIDLVCADVIQYLGGGNLYGARKLAYYHAHQPNNGWCNSTGVTSWNGAFEATAQAAAEAAAAEAAAAEAATKAAAEAAAAAKATAEAEAAEVAAKAAAEAATKAAAEAEAAAKAAAEAEAATKAAAEAEAAAKAAAEAEAAAKAAAEAEAATKAAAEAEAATKAAAEAEAAAKAAAEAEAVAKAAAEAEAAIKAAAEAEAAAKAAADAEVAAKAAAEAEAAVKAATDAETAAKAVAEAEAAAKVAAEAEAAAKAAEEVAKNTADCSGTDGADAPTSTTVSWDDDKGTNSYGFAVSREGNTWTYQVNKTGGKDLSHWTLIVPNCVAKVSNATNGVETGQDGSIKDRSVSGIKWNSEGGTFSFTLDGDYAVSTVEVLAKAGNGYSTSMIMGPDCSMPASNQCPPKDPEVPVDVSGAFYNADDSICSYVPKATQSKNGKDLSGWTLPQWVAVEGYIEATQGGKPVETTVAVVGNDSVKICSAGLMVGNCHEDDAAAMQSVTTNEDGKADFTALVYWPGVSADDRANGGTVDSSYSINVMGGPAGTTVVGGLAKKLLWNPGMMNEGCTLTLKARK